MSITNWPTDDRPREKLLDKGAQALSDSELLALLLRTGVHGKSAVDLSRELLHDFSGLRQLLEADYADISTHKGIGIAKYAQLQAILEIGRRCFLEDAQQGDQLSNSDKVKQYLISNMRHLDHEVFMCIYLNNQNKILKFDQLFKGSITSSAVYPREVVKSAIKYKATAVIFAHNHPSGLLAASKSDKKLTQKLILSLKTVDIQVLDHIIVADNKTLSFFEQGFL